MSSWWVRFTSSCLIYRRRQWHPTPVLLPGKPPWTEKPGGLQSMGSLRVGHDWVTSLSLSCIGEGNGNPLQCSCLENPRGGGAWWAAVYGAAQSQTRLKWLSSSRLIYGKINNTFWKMKNICFLLKGSCISPSWKITMDKRQRIMRCTQI